MLVENTKPGYVRFFKTVSGDWVVTYFLNPGVTNFTGPMILVDNQHFGQVISDSSFARSKCVIIKQERCTLSIDHVAFSFNAPEKLVNEYYLMTEV